MAGTLKVGGNTIATHTGVEGAGTVSANNVSLGNNVQFPAGHVIQVQTYTEYKNFAQTLDNGISNSSAI